MICVNSEGCEKKRVQGEQEGEHYGARSQKVKGVSYEKL
jgi:hypothetical protein